MTELYQTYPISNWPADYELHVRGHLADAWAEWFTPLTLRRHPDGYTILAGPVMDQPALHGLLDKVRDMGLELISLNLIKNTKTEEEVKHERQSMSS